MKLPKGATSVAIAALVAAALGGGAAASPAQNDSISGLSGAQASGKAPKAQKEDNREGPYTAKQNALKKEAHRKLRQGKAKEKNGVTQLGSTDFVETTVAKSDKIFTVLAEFSGAGEQHNQIPQPDRANDNSTLWVPDFNVAHYNTMFNAPTNSMKDFYEKQSNGKYSVTNTVEDWVKVKGTKASYGGNDVEERGGAWNFIQDSLNAWYEAQAKAGKTPEQIDQYLSQFDVWDRYDYDGDGNFNEPDGYLDHFQAVHSGEGEEAGAGDDAIWSHRWYAYGNLAGKAGPETNKAGGVKIGQSKYWVGDYTTEPENGGLGVFAHEFGHDLGLPDFYDTSGKGENSTGFWTIMSAGSWLGRDEVVGTGDSPSGFGPDEKLQLGWLKGSNVPVGTTQTRTLNPSQFHVDGKDQAVLVNLPDKKERISFTEMVQGKKAWWTGAAPNLNGSLTAEVTATTGQLTVTADLWYDIEADYDYLYPEYSVDGGKTWKLAVNTITGKAEPLTGDSGNQWTSVAYAYDPAGRASKFRFRYETDGATENTGAFVDNLRIKGKGVNVQTRAEGSTLAKGFSKDANWTANPGYMDKVTDRYYLIENRQFQGYDAVLKTGPYNYGSGQTRPSWVQYFQYTPGMLVWSVDNAYKDNNTSQHPGYGQALVVDARVAPITSPEGLMPMGGRRQSYDATFGTGTWQKLCLPTETKNGLVTPCAPEAPQAATFDDTNPNAYYNPNMPFHSAIVAGHGVKATVTGQQPDGSLTVSITNPAAQ